MEKDGRHGKRQGRNVVDDDHDESLNILGFAGGSDRVHNAANALESTLLRPSTSSKIINKASLWLVRKAGTVARPDLSGLLKKAASPILKKVRDSTLFRDVVSSSLSLRSKETYQPTLQKDFTELSLAALALLSLFSNWKPRKNLLSFCDLASWKIGQPIFQGICLILRQRSK